MDRDWDIGLSARYAARLLGDARLKPQHRREILISLADDCATLRAVLPAALWSAALASRDGSAASNKAFAEAWAAHGRPAIAALKQMAKSRKGGKFIKRNVAYLGRLAGLSKVERKLIATLAAYHASETVETVCDDACAARIALIKLLGVASGVDADDAVAALGAQGTLVRTGLIAIDTDGAYFSNRFELRGGLREALIDRECDEATLRGKLLGGQRQTTLTTADFDHMAAERDFCIQLLTAAARQGEAGINILLHGAPGCGKTEFAALIAKEAGLALHSVGDRHVTCGEQQRAERLSDLALHVSLLRAGDAALLFDEIEDVAVNLIGRGGSKLHFNRLLESNTVPVLWTSNTLNRIDPALVRRMTHVVEFRHPAARQRAQIWQSIAACESVELSAERATELGHRFDASPAVIRSAVRSAKLTGSEDTCAHITHGLVRALGGRIANHAASAVTFDPALARASRDLALFADRLTAKGALNVSFCFSGPAGTGKSAYARVLANRLGLEVIEKRASDLMSKWVGETERLIAEAFRDASEQRAFLIFDEADSLLHDRGRARASWEVTQVNEMLTWMESHSLPFCCTTNLIDRLDPASLRRFVFDIRFDYLDRTGMAAAWASFFPEAGPAPCALGGIANLTPGDFAKVRRGADMLGEASNPGRLFAALEDASRAKPGRGGVIGFRIAAE